MFHKQWLKVLSCILLLACCVGSQTSQADELSPQTDPFPPLVPIFRSPDKLKPLARIGDGWINDVALSPDNKTLAVATTIGVYLYDVEAFDEEPIRLDEDLSSIRDVAYSPDGRYLAVAGKTLQLWDTAKNNLLNVVDDTLGTNTVYTDSLLFSLDSTQLAYFSSEAVKIWHLETNEIRTFASDYNVGGASFNLEGTRIIADVNYPYTASYLPSVWDIATGEELGKAEGIYTNNWLPDPQNGGWIGIGFESIERWSEKLEEKLLTVPVDLRPIAMRLTPDGQHALYMDGGGVLFKIDTKSLEVDSTISLPVRSRFPEFSQDASLVITVTGSRIQIWNVEDGKLFAERKHFAVSIPRAITADRKYFATFDSVPGYLLIHDVITGEAVSRIQAHSGSINAVAFSPSGQRLASSGTDNTIRIWDTAKGTPTQVIYNIDRDIRLLQFSGENYLYLVGDSSTLQIYDLRAGQFVDFAWDPENDSPVNHVQAEDDVYITVLDESQFISLSAEGGIYFKLGDYDIWHTLVYKDLLKRAFNAIATTHSNYQGDRLIAFGGNNGVVLLFDRSKPDPSTMMFLTLHDSWIYTLDFSPDDYVLASAGCAKTDYIRNIWDAPLYYEFYCYGADLRLWYAMDTAVPAYKHYHQQYNQITIPVAHKRPIHKVIFNSEGTILTTFSEDGTMMHWGVLEEDVPEYLRD